VTQRSQIDQKKDNLTKYENYLVKAGEYMDMNEVKRAEIVILTASQVY
jgi:hypothetical protein